MDLNARWETSSPEINRAEIKWWEKYSEVEEKYCWVQTTAVQKYLRQHYIHQMAALIPPEGRVLEFGCGTGWLSLLLADRGLFQVCGVDFSSEQIRRAQLDCAKRGVQKRVEFYLLNGSLTNLSEYFSQQPIDALIFHGVLHHLVSDEIRSLLADFCNLLSPQALVFIIEPVVYENQSTTRLAKGAEQLIDRLIHLPLSGQTIGVRRRSDAEMAVQRIIDERSIGVPPRGPSPKEMPFKVGELEKLVDPFFQIQSSKPVLCFSFHAARNLLLMRLTYPLLASLLMWPYLCLVRLVERWVLANYPKYGSGGYCLFELKICSRKKTQTAQ